MTQTNEDLKTKLYKIMSKDLVLSAKTHIEVMNAIDEIMSLISQPEQLEVEILSRANIDDRPNRWLVEYKYATLDYFLTEQKAIDFCKRFNLKLKVVNEEQSK